MKEMYTLYILYHIMFQLCSVSGDSWRALARACPRIEGLMFWGMGLGQFYQWDALRFLLEKLKLKEFSCVCHFDIKKISEFLGRILVRYIENVLRV